MSPKPSRPGSLAWHVSSYDPNLVLDAAGTPVAIATDTGDANAIAQLPALLHAAKLARAMTARIATPSRAETLATLDAVIAAAENR